MTVLNLCVTLPQLIGHNSIYLSTPNGVD